MKEEQSNPCLISKDTKEKISLIYNITMKRREMLTRIQSSMHQQFDPIMQQKEHSCVCCFKIFIGKQIGAHYRNHPKCKYKKDRPWLTEVPPNWKEDLQQFQKDNEGIL